ncbi:MAG: 4Fe-4S dicluster domain-containing protein, partial [Candidatus Cryptobacteroides sp.]
RLCEKGCKSSCIDIDAHKVDSSRCVVCMDCISNCHRGAVSYGWRWGKGVSVKSGESCDTADKRGGDTAQPQDAGRRAFVGGALIAVGSTALKAQQVKLDGGLAEVTLRKPFKRQTPLKPAGAVSLKHFSRHCTACQLCVSVCPNDVLRPSTSLDTFMQPEMSYERGFCRPECTRCSEVCPNDAILEISREEKSSTQIGHAVVDLDNCVVKTDGVSCGNCARRCPAGAIKLVRLNPEDSQSLRIPAVNEERCIGCGACEHLCPAQPFPAIHIEGHTVHRTI